MRRWAPAWPEALKGRAARYALERSLGPYLEERLRLEQLSLDLRGGTGTLRDLRLRAAAVDEALAGAPLELREGCAAAVTVTVPWAALGTEPCGLHVQGLRLALGPRQHRGTGTVPPPTERPDPARDPPPEPPPLEGLEALTQTIESVLRRLRVVLEDTVLRLELPPPSAGGPGAALELHLPRVEYEDEGGLEAAPPPAVLLKGLRLRDLRLFQRQLPRDTEQEPPQEEPPPPVLLGFSPGPSQLALRLKQNQALPGPSVEVSGSVGALQLLLPPPALGALRGLLEALGPPEPGAPPGGSSRPLGPQDLALIERELSRCLGGGGRPPDPPGDDPDSELFYSMTGSLGGGSASPPPEETPPSSPPPSPAGSSRRRPAPPPTAAPPGGAPPGRGGLRVHLTLGALTATLPYGEGGAGAEPELGHAHPGPHLSAQAGAELGVPGGPRGHLSLARLQLWEELPGAEPGAEPHRLQILRFPGAPSPTAPPQPCLRLRYGPPGPPQPGDPPLRGPPPARSCCWS